MLKTNEAYGIQETTVDELFQNLGQVRIVDVRTPAEFREGVIQGATLVTLGPELVEYLEGLQDKDSEVVFVCRSGGRSARAAAIALEMGFKAPINLVGGMSLWEAAQHPTVQPK